MRNIIIQHKDMSHPSPSLFPNEKKKAGGQNTILESTNPCCPPLFSFLETILQDGFGFSFSPFLFLFLKLFFKFTFLPLLLSSLLSFSPLSPSSHPDTGFFGNRVYYNFLQNITDCLPDGEQLMKVVDRW